MAINSHPTVMGTASASRNRLRPKDRDHRPAGMAPTSAPNTYTETTNDDFSMFTGKNKKSPAVCGISGGVQPATTVPEANDIIEAEKKRSEDGKTGDNPCRYGPQRRVPRIIHGYRSRPVAVIRGRGNGESLNGDLSMIS